MLQSALLLSACAPPVAQVPTATPAPTATATPTATPTAAPTATPRPTATPLAASADAIGAALAQTAAAGSYTLNMVVTGSGAVLAGPGGPQQAELATLAGSFRGDDYEYTLTGAAATLLTGAPDLALRVIRSGGTAYLRGPVPLLGAPEDVWYRLSPEQATLAVPPISAASTAGALAAGRADFGGFSFAADELRAGQSCRRYSGDRTATLGLLQSLEQSGLPLDGDPQRIDRAASAVVVCADGYLYDLDLAFAGQTAGEQPQPYSYDLQLRLSDFDAVAPIDAPPAARPIPAPTR